ncbi:MAG: metal-dependent hydrolase [Desulfotomaculales bacterium]
MGYTHLAGGALFGAVAGLAAGEPVTGAVVGAVTGLLPDIDHPGSLAGRRVPILPVILSVVAGHRTATHTVWFCLAVAVGAGAVAVPLAGWAWAWVAAPALLGSLSHLILDGCTRSGVQPFAPLTLSGKMARLNHVKGPFVTGTALVEGPLAFLMLVLTLKVAGLI